MQQLSRPYQFALGALLVFALAWFTVLKPGDEVAAEPLPAAATGPTAAPGAAQAAVGDADAAAAASGAAAPSPSAVPVQPAAGAPAAKTDKPARRTGPDRSPAILADLDAGKVTVLTFLQPSAGDDAAVRRALRAVDRRGGRVRVRTASIEDVGRYASITAGVTVQQAPTVLVIGPDRRARTLVGLTDAKIIDEAVDDARGRRTP